MSECVYAFTFVCVHVYECALSLTHTAHVLLSSSRAQALLAVHHILTQIDSLTLSLSLSLWCYVSDLLAQEQSKETIMFVVELHGDVSVTACVCACLHECVCMCMNVTHVYECEVLGGARKGSLLLSSSSVTQDLLALLHTHSSPPLLLFIHTHTLSLFLSLSH